MPGLQYLVIVYIIRGWVNGFIALGRLLGLFGNVYILRDIFLDIGN